ncbi:serine protease 33 isoform X2 [Bombina bombina]|uniref:serine protease 33 isoform X2 n=1 Tax=Bombina bombina TaxID=8345 RepID=UPI00235AED74|nr:serine protease 33 isoform X2 [Bombina bombina]
MYTRSRTLLGSLLLVIVECGNPQDQSRIMGGESALNGAWPWQVSLRYNGFHFCGGSLISKKWVISAAHCFKSYRPSTVYVYLGSYNLDQSSSQEVAIKVKTALTNNNYNGEGTSGDISLVELETEVNYTNYILPVCLPSAGVLFPTGMYCWVTGWGDIRSGVNLPSPRTLQEVKLPLIDANICDSLYHINSNTNTNVKIIFDDMICAGYKAGGKDSCQGDSGGPLVCSEGGRWYLAGLVSFGEGCGKVNRPGVYIQLAAYANWIVENAPEASAVMRDVNITSPVDRLSYLKNGSRAPSLCVPIYLTTWTLLLYKLL